jgi:hypothetical protein
MAHLEQQAAPSGTGGTALGVLHFKDQVLAAEGALPLAEGIIVEADLGGAWGEVLAGPGIARTSWRRG